MALVANLLDGLEGAEGSPLPLWMPGDGTFMISWFRVLSAKADTPSGAKPLLDHPEPQLPRQSPLEPSHLSVWSHFPMALGLVTLQPQLRGLGVP